ncbi:MAG: hypothetical protein AB1758_03845, partial [Candidatus Eremiobacterota bacterium]
MVIRGFGPTLHPRIRPLAAAREAGPADTVQLSGLSVPATGLATAVAAVPAAGPPAELAKQLAAEGFRFQHRPRWWFIQLGWRDCTPEKAATSLEKGRPVKARQEDGPWVPLPTPDALTDLGPSYALFRENANQLRSWRPEGGWGPTFLPDLGAGWGDSPGRDYEARQDVSLSSSPLSLQGLTGCSAVFRCAFALESGYDKVALEASEDGQSWTSLATYTGEEGPQEQRVDLSAYDGRSVRLRFRLTSDGSTEKEGFEFGSFRIEGRDGAGKTVQLLVDGRQPGRDLEALREGVFSLNPARRRAALECVAELTRQLGTGGQAVELLPALDAELSQPDRSDRLADLTRLTRTLGAPAARELWPRMAGQPRTERQAELTRVEELAREFGPAGAAHLWREVAGQRPGADRVEALAELGRLLTPEKAAPAYRSLEPRRGTWEERVQRYTAAHLLSRLGGTDEGSLYTRLEALPAGSLHQLSTLGEHVSRGWRPEGRWGQEDEFRWGRVWSDSPGGPYDEKANASLTSSRLDLSGLTQPQVRLTAAHELESGYDKVTLEARVVGRDWMPLHEFTGEQTTPGEVAVSLAPVAGKAVELRLRLTSDGSTQGEGMRFRDFRVEGQASGKTLVRRLEDPLGNPRDEIERVLQTVLGAQQPAATLDALFRSAEELGEGRTALALWPVLQRDLGKADFESRRAGLTALAGRAGAEPALFAWEVLAQLPQPEREAGQAEVGRLARKLDSWS